MEDVRQETVEVMHAFEQSCLPLEKEHVQVGRSKAKLCDDGHELLGKTRVVDDRVVHDEAASMLLLVQHPVLRHFLQRHTQILRHRPQQLQTQLRDLYALAEAAARNYLQHLPQLFLGELRLFLEEPAQILSVLEQIFVPREDSLEAAFDSFVAHDHQLLSKLTDHLFCLLYLYVQRSANCRQQKLNWGFSTRRVFDHNSIFLVWRQMG